LVGVGIGRFAFTPLIPALIAGGWADAAGAGYLGAANLVGYLAGSVLSLWGLARAPAAPVVRVALVASAVGAAASSWPLGFAWLAMWRFVVGAAGSVLMIVGASAAIGRLPPARRAAGSGIVFTGVGLGVAASGALVPLLAAKGIALTWLVFAAVVTLAAAASWRVWRALPPPAPAPQAASVPGLRRAVVLLLAAYTLDAIGFVPHTVFWVDFIARELGRGLTVGGSYWIVFGLGALVGPIAVGALAARLGAGRALVLAVLAKALAVALPIGAQGAPALAISSFVVGALSPGTAALVSARLAEMLPQAAQRGAWARATLCFAVAQAAGGYAFAALRPSVPTDRWLFALATCVLVAALAAAWGSERLARQARQGA
jgi:predicted MFS family arabinose efflux permease